MSTGSNLSIAQQRSDRAVTSALWAAAGDALGWITELGGEDAVKARTGHDFVSRPIEWKRRIGGRGGVVVQLPAGTYSDDTQLRLAVCRSIRGNGVFDAEAFARIELTAWQGYLLGAGLGSKAAAGNLTKRGVNWYSNFFETGRQSYTRAGGNGAAMRVQPHAWIERPLDEMILAVMRDAVVTHGHAHGFVGAVLHALAVREAMAGQVVNPDDLDPLIGALRSIPQLVRRDRQLEAFWLPAWEQRSEMSLEQAVDRAISELAHDAALISAHLGEANESAYRHVLNQLGLFEDRYRGSGLKTSFAAIILSWMYRDTAIETALVVAANALGSDTDTIATMVGAILGAITTQKPDWDIQDEHYITVEARRVASITPSNAQDSFAYPDLAGWMPPSNQSDSVVELDGQLAILGLGVVEPAGVEHRAGDAIWQWMRLPFGQTVLAKRRVQLSASSSDQLPRERRVPFERQQSNAQPQGEFGFNSDRSRVVSDEKPKSADMPSIDDITEQVIRSNFDPLIIGQALNWIVENSGRIEDAVSFTSIIAKARLARLKRHLR